MRIEYHPAIEKELREIIQHYNHASAGLGIKFLNEFEQQILKITTMPNSWAIVAGDTRRCLMKRFPYVIYFRVIDNDTLRVTVIKHQHRHPDYGTKRQ